MKLHLATVSRIFIGLASTTAFCSAHAAEQAYKVDSSHSSVGFEVRHIFTKVKGTFAEFEGQFKIDDQKPEADNVTFKIAVKSINTNDPKRDKHLRTADFFDADAFPSITFKSKKVTSTGKDKMKITGDMTMHGVTKEVTFDVEALGSGKDPWGHETSSFSATSQINRKDFGIVWNKTLDSGSLMVGDDVKIELQIEADKDKPAGEKDKK